MSGSDFSISRFSNVSLQDLTLIYFQDLTLIYFLLLRGKMKSIEQVFRQCEKTGAWYGIEITNFTQRNDLGDSVLHTVCSWGDVNAVKILVAAGADVNARGDQGATPLFNAVIGDSSEVVSFLLSVGADPKISNDYKRLVLDYAKNVSASLAIIELLERASRKPKPKPKR